MAVGGHRSNMVQEAGIRKLESRIYKTLTRRKRLSVAPKQQQQLNLGMQENKELRVRMAREGR